MGCGGSRSIEEIEQANDIEDRQKSSNGTIRRVSGHSQSVSLPFVGFLGNLKTLSLTINLDQFSNCMITGYMYIIFFTKGSDVSFVQRDRSVLLVSTLGHPPPVPNNTKKSDIFNIADFAEIDKKAAKVHMSFYSMNFAFI